MSTVGPSSMTLPISIRSIDCTSSGVPEHGRRWTPASPASHAAEERIFGADRVRGFRRHQNRPDAIFESPNRAADASSSRRSDDAPAFFAREVTPEAGVRRPSDDESPDKHE